MTAATINRINAAIEKHGVMICKGDGYFFFADLDDSPDFNADKIESVYTCHLRALSLEDWVEHVEDALTPR